MLIDKYVTTIKKYIKKGKISKPDLSKLEVMIACTKLQQALDSGEITKTKLRNALKKS